MDKDTIKGILAKYSPPLAPSQMNEIAEAIMTQHLKDLKQFRAKLKPSKPKRSQSSSMTRRRG